MTLDPRAQLPNTSKQIPNKRLLPEFHQCLILRQSLVLLAAGLYCKY